MSKEQSALVSVPLSVADAYFLTWTTWLSSSEDFRKRNELVPPQLSGIGTWHLAYVRPIISKKNQIKTSKRIKHGLHYRSKCSSCGLFPAKEVNGYRSES